MGSKKFFFSGQKKFFFGSKKIFFVGHASLKLWWNDHKNLGGIISGFGFYHNFIFLFYWKDYKKVMLQLPNSPISHFHQQTHFAPNPTWTTFLWVASPACFHWATPCLLRKHQVYNISIRETPFRVWISVCASKLSLKWQLKWLLKWLQKWLLKWPLKWPLKQRE